MLVVRIERAGSSSSQLMRFLRFVILGVFWGALNYEWIYSSEILLMLSLEPLLSYFLMNTMKILEQILSRFPSSLERRNPISHLSILTFLDNYEIITNQKMRNIRKRLDHSQISRSSLMRSWVIKTKTIPHTRRSRTHLYDREVWYPSRDLSSHREWKKCCESHWLSIRQNDLNGIMSMCHFSQRENTSSEKYSIRIYPSKKSSTRSW